MRRNKTNKTKLVVLLLILVLLISVGYAALTTNLQINGNATIKAQRWSVHFNNIVVDSNNSVASVTTAPTLSNNDTTLTWEVSMDTPGQVYAFNVDVVNDGTIDAMVETATADIITSTLTDAQKKYLDYTIKYVNGAPIEQYDKLEAGETKTITVKLLFKNDDTVNPGDLPSTEQTGISLSYTTNYVQADGNARTKVTKNLAIGDTVNYTTSLNGVTLDNWKVFYVDGDYTYLILDGYLPNAAISSDVKANYNLSTGGINPWSREEDIYNVYATSNREDLINAMTTKANWDSLLTGTINEHAVNETRTENVWAMGSPTVDLWVNSWNASYPGDTLYTRYIGTEEVDKHHFYATGYAISDTTPVTCAYIFLDDKTGYNNTLYWVSQRSNVWGCVDDYASAGYWLASPSAANNNYAANVGYAGYVNRVYSGSENTSFRPVVCLPSSVVNQ